VAMSVHAKSELSRSKGKSEFSTLQLPIWGHDRSIVLDEGSMKSSSLATL
jgi:hypothetical protein